MQYRKNLLVLLLLLVAASVMGVFQRGPNPEPVASSPTPKESAVPPPLTPAMVATPEVFSGTLEPLDSARGPVLKKIVKARFETTQGPLSIEIYPEAAPRAAERFIKLIQARFYDDTPLFRVEPGFIVQFGINSKMAVWNERNFKDDPPLFRLGPGTLGFAKAGPDTNTTQVFINYADNTPLVEQGGFTAFAKVTKGFEQTFRFKRVEEAGDQAALWQDTAGFLEGLKVKPDQILTARIVP